MTALLHPAPPVTPERFEQVTGVTKRAVEGKIYRGEWVEGREYYRGPDKRIYIDLRGFEQWVKGKK